MAISVKALAAALPPGPRPRAKTIPAKRLTVLEREAADHLDYPDVERPKTRGDCAIGPRPCPWVSCAHHNYLDVDPRTGTIKLNFPHLEPDEIPVTCSLDLADQGGATLDEVGRAQNITRERIRQIETRAFAKGSRVEGVEFPEDQDRAGTPTPRSATCP
jgi:hypothetical protein